VTEPAPAHHPSFTVLGLRTRTTNALETDAATARIPGLWHRWFAGGGAAQLSGSAPHAASYGLYHAYESDHRGAYDLVVGAAMPSTATPPPGFTRVDVPAAPYLVFRGIGARPAIVIQTWATVWEYFANHSDVRRAYTMDFERYDPAQGDQVDIYIAITDARDAGASQRRR